MVLFMINMINKHHFIQDCIVAVIDFTNKETCGGHIDYPM